MTNLTKIKIFERLFDHFVLAGMYHIQSLDLSFGIPPLMEKIKHRVYLDMDIDWFESDEFYNKPIKLYNSISKRETEFTITMRVAFNYLLLDYKLQHNYISKSKYNEEISKLDVEVLPF